MLQRPRLGPSDLHLRAQSFSIWAAPRSHP